MAGSCFKEGKFSAPGFRFHPTDEELVVYYLKRKICGRRLRVDVIGVTDVYKMDPSELPGLSLLKTGDRQWFFFTPRSRKYPNAARSGRCTTTGYWKATGKDRVIVYNSRPVGLKKTLVFYRGRAPNGERTDWVMHEYTMDEDELGRCKNVKNYYALYKLFKKSGAGPKNGEEYGAPFQEEEWVDDNEDADDVAVPDDPSVLHEHRHRGDDRMLCNPVNVQLDDIENLLNINEIQDAPGVFARQINELSGVQQANSKGEMQSTLMNNFSGEFLTSRKFLPNSQLYKRHSSVVSANSVEAPEVRSVLKTSGIAPLVFEKEDYIEMNDLLLPELGASSTEKSAPFLNQGEVGEVNEFDQLFHDISMSLDLEPVCQGISPGLSSLSNFANNISDQKQEFFYQQFQEETPENQLNNFIDPSPALNQFTDSMWLQDDQAVLFDQQQSFSGEFASPSSGVMPESTNPSKSVSGEDQEGQNGGGTTSPFSSALWGYMESLPSTPASACEGPLNRTYLRMSSFSRIRFSGKANGTLVTNGTSVTSSKVAMARKRSRNRGFLLLSIMGAMCAIFWLFITTVGVPGRPVLS